MPATYSSHRLGGLFVIIIIFVAGLFAGKTACAQQSTLTILHAFGGTAQGDGSVPMGGVIQANDGNFYGVTEQGGSAGVGTFYQMTPAGTVTILHSFDDGSVQNDGEYPFTAPVQGSDGNFYGTTLLGGSANYGIVYRITPTGSITILHSFQDGSIKGDGLWPEAGLIQASDGNFYGTTAYGGSPTSLNPSCYCGGYGTVFQMTPAGAVTILHSFCDGSVSDDARTPEARLVQGCDGNLYGTSVWGGSSNSGTVFQITLTGDVTVLHSFDGLCWPGGLVQASDGNFYGTTVTGGAAGYGTAYGMTPTGSVLILHSFWDGSVLDDGASPQGIILGGDGNLYGMSNWGGSTAAAGKNGGFGYGTVFRMTLAGTETILHSFGDGSVANDGLLPSGGLIQASDGDLYGTTTHGSTADGTVFQLALNPGSASAIIGLSETRGLALDSITITGEEKTNLTGATSVLINGASASFTVKSSTQIVAVVPCNGTKHGEVTVKTHSGTLTSSQIFTYVSPTITSFTPAMGPVGTSVTIHGTGLIGISSIKFNGVSAPSWTRTGKTQVVVPVPAGATTGKISITTSGGTVTSASSFTVR